LKFDELPKKPEDALYELLPRLIRLLSSAQKQAPLTQAFNGPMYDNIHLHFMACSSVSKRVRDSKFVEFADKSFENGLDKSPSNLAASVNNVLQALNIVRMDDHFISQDDEDCFERSTVPTEERAEIRAMLENARLLTERALYLDDKQKRRVLHKIAKAENELFKESVGFSQFMAAAYEVSDFVRKFGSDAKPLAETIQTATTKTERHLQGYDALESPAQPRQIEGPKD